jgi:hypothetical protein
VREAVVCGLPALRERADGLLDLAVVGEAAGDVLGEDQGAVHFDVEDAVRAADQLRLDPEFTLQ